MRIYAMTNQKGGVGKTANTINTGAALAEKSEQNPEQKRVLLVDFDPQGHMSEALGVEETPDDKTLRMALVGEWRNADPRQIIVQRSEYLHVIPTNVDMHLLERSLYTVADRERRLSRFLEKVDDDYDVCLIDCAPSLGVITDCSLYAARKREGKGRSGIVVPVEAEDSSVRALRLLLRQIGLLSEDMDIVLDVLGLVPSRFDVRDGNVVTSMLEAFRGLGEPAVIGEIRKRTIIREAWRAKQTIIEHAPQSDAADWYRDLAKAVDA
ncbi:ParA family protein [Streptomyces sp. A1547]|uniref:ParA family protein n=1 Tax=Streptomyces sp. A1547 TaxID=2563105 RepID=UPI00109E793C|nr:ParA family protein [Streptomyces sp. A1547]THA28470.1 ParA family protein [Streptomyces sp. A1547]